MEDTELPESTFRFCRNLPFFYGSIRSVCFLWCVESRCLESHRSLLTLNPGPHGSVISEVRPPAGSDAK